MLQVDEQKKMGDEKFHVKRGALTFSNDVIRVQAVPGEVKEGSFMIYGPDGSAASGFVLSSQIPMKVLTPAFDGAREVISYRFDSSAFRAGDQLAGIFRILSDTGEFQLPFMVQVGRKELESSLGPIRNLVHFTNLARVSWQEAVQLFYRPEFRDIVADAEHAQNKAHNGDLTRDAGDAIHNKSVASNTQNAAHNADIASDERSADVVPDEQKAVHSRNIAPEAHNAASTGKEKEGERTGNLLTLYRGLSVREGNAHNVEEFLIAIGGKQPAEFAADCREIREQISSGYARVIRKTIRIRRSGWGYTAVEAAVTGDFLSIGTVKTVPALGAAGSSGNNEMGGRNAHGNGAVLLGDDDFRDGTAEVNVYLDPSEMHAGRNYGHVILAPAYGDPIVIPVEVSFGINTALQILRRKEGHEVILQMMREYIAFRGQKITGKKFHDEMAGLIRRLYETDRNNPRTVLYRIHYMLTVNDGNDAFWELQALNRNLSGMDGEIPAFSMEQYEPEDDTTYAYRMYLTGLVAVSRMENTPQNAAELNRVVEETTRAVEEMHKRNPDNFWIAWLLIYADADYSRRTRQTAAVLADQYARGSRSPILYMEAWQLMQADPALLTNLGDYELQVLAFAARNGLLYDAAMAQINYLAVRRKTFSMKLFRILARAYEDAETGENRTTRETLESICTLLIRGNMTDSSYFIWYQRGVEQGLSITRLLDYYMLSLPADYKGELPQMVLMYYAYQNFLPYRQNAYLYRYICEHRDQYPELYQQYAPAIDQFTIEQLGRHRISPDLAWLYTRYMTAGRVLTNEIAAAAVPAVFACEVRIGGEGEGRSGNGGAEKTDVGPDHAARAAGVSGLVNMPGIPEAYARAAGSRIAPQRIVVLCDCDTEETYCPLAWDPGDNGADGILPIYGKDSCIFFEDGQGNRFAATVPYTQTWLMDYRKLGAMLSVYETANAGYDLYLVTEGKADAGSGAGEMFAARLRKISGRRELMPAVQVRLQRELLDVCDRMDDEKRLRDLLQEISLVSWDCDARNEALRMMTVRGLFAAAWKWVCSFGTDEVDADVLLRLVTGVILEGTPVDDTALSEMAHAVFVKGKYDTPLLQYLGEFYDGFTSELDAVRTAIVGYGLDDFQVSRRMLIQMLFTGERTESRPALAERCRKGGLGAGFLADVLAQSGHFYYIDGEEMPDSAFALIAEYGMEGVPLLDICRIAWLYHASGRQGEIKDRDLEVTGLFLADLLKRGVVFPFFRQFVGLIPGMEAYADVTLVEYRSGNAGVSRRNPPIQYHYAMEQNGVRDKYAAKEMKEMYSGVYVTGFLLFFGEQMHYYITDDAAEKNVVESGTVSQDARLTSATGDRFTDINEIAMLVALGRDEEAIRNLDQYGRKAFLAQGLFGRKGADA